MKLATEPEAERVLILTPTGRDAEMVRQQLVADGLDCEICVDLPALLAGIVRGAGAAIVAQEALTAAGAEQLLGALRAQAPWSDIPILFLANSRSTKRSRVLPGYFEHANVTLLQRPLGIRLLLSSVRSALRARRRQYEMRDLYLELERAVQLSDMFVSILGHDLRNPMAAIKMSAESIAVHSPDERTYRATARILNSTNRMTRMVEQLLDLARTRLGRGIPLHVGRTHLGEICREALQELRDAHPGARLDSREIGDLFGVWDADRLAQVVTNLAGNAVEHGTEDKPVTLEIDGTDAATVRLRVRNFGMIPSEILPVLFEPFKQTRALSTSRKHGLGLGMFIAREIARAHGGDIVVRSAVDRTSLEVTLPREARPVDTGALTKI